MPLPDGGVELANLNELPASAVPSTAAPVPPRSNAEVICAPCDDQLEDNEITQVIEKSVVINEEDLSEIDEIDERDEQGEYV